MPMLTVQVSHSLEIMLQSDALLQQKTTSKFIQLLYEDWIRRGQPALVGLPTWRRY